MRTSLYLPTLVTVAILVVVTALVSTHSPALANDDHGDTRLTATRINIGSLAVAGNIGDSRRPIDVDFFSFSTQRGASYSVVVDAVSVEKVSVSASISNNRFPGLFLRSTSGTLTTIDWVAPSSNTYYVEVAGLIDSGDASPLLGDYTLKVSEDATNIDLHSDNANGAEPIIAENTYQGSISPWYPQPGSYQSVSGTTDVDYFSFDAARGVRYTVDIELETSDGVAVSILDSGDNVQESAEGATSLSWTSPDTAGYFISVTGTEQVRDSWGTYALTLLADTTLQDHHSQSWDTATPASFGNAHQGSISPAADSDYFSFQARRGVVYTLSAELGTAEEVEIAILDRDLEVLASNGGTGSTLVWPAPFEGKLVAAVSASTQVPDVLGTYSLTIAADPQLEDRYGESANRSLPISFGTLYQGAISPIDDQDFFSFSAERGVVYQFMLTYGTADAVSLSVNTLNGSPADAARNFGEAAELRWTADSDADYYAEVTASHRVENKTGTYSLQVFRDRTLQDRHSDDLSKATRLGIGNVTKGAISPPGDYDYFYFQAQKGVTYTVNAQLDSIGALRFTVENSAAGFSASNYDLETSLDWTAPVSGGYLLSVSAASETASPTGTYVMIVAPKRETAPEPVQEPIAIPVIGPDETALTIGARSAVPGRTVRVPLTLSNAQDITSLSFHLNYDPNILEIANVWQGPHLPANSWSHSNDDSGVLRYLYAVPEPLANADPLAVVEFQVAATDATVTQLTLSDVLSGHVSTDPVEVKLRGADLAIGQRMLGDGDGDGQIRALDAFIALRETTNTGEQDLSLDVDSDGSVTLDDVYLILSMARPF